MDKLTWHNERRKVDELLPYKENPRQMTEEQAKQLRASLEKFDLVEVPAINTDNTIVAGHMRLKTLQLLGRGQEEIDVRVPSRSLTEEELREYNLRSNKNTGEWDYDLLANFEPELLLEIGWSKDELQKIFDIKVDETEPMEPPAESTIKLGDMFKLGRHRLICGDSTDPAVVERLMQDELADLVFTDPPFNIGWDYDDRGRNRFNPKHKASKVFKKSIFEDKWKPEDFVNFLTTVFSLAYTYTKDEMTLYVCYGGKYQSWTIEAMELNNFHYSQNLLWVKERMIPMPGQLYHHLYEGIAVGWKKGKKHHRNFEYNLEDVFAFDRDRFGEFINLMIDVWYEERDILNTYEHATQKPIRLPGRAIKVSCPIDGLVIDFFGGSGSTLLACEQLERLCRMIELNPRYCDVIIGRWEKMTGLKAEKL